MWQGQPPDNDSRGVEAALSSSAGSDVDEMGYLSDGEWQEPESYTDSRRNQVAQMRRDGEVSEYASEVRSSWGPGCRPTCHHDEVADYRPSLGQS
jgi:hypothetical protein